MFIFVGSTGFDSSIFVFYSFCLGVPNIPLFVKLFPKLVPIPRPPKVVVLVGLVSGFDSLLSLGALKMFVPVELMVLLPIMGATVSY